MTSSEIKGKNSLASCHNGEEEKRATNVLSVHQFAVSLFRGAPFLVLQKDTTRRKSREPDTSSGDTRTTERFLQKGKKEREEKEKKIRTRVLECEQLVLQGTTEQQAGYNNRKKTTRVNYTLSPWTRQLGYKRERRLSFMRIRTKLRQQRDEKITVR